MHDYASSTHPKHIIKCDLSIFHKSSSRVKASGIDKKKQGERNAKTHSTNQPLPDPILQRPLTLVFVHFHHLLLRTEGSHCPYAPNRIIRDLTRLLIHCLCICTETLHELDLHETTRSYQGYHRKNDERQLPTGFKSDCQPNSCRRQILNHLRERVPHESTHAGSIGRQPGPNHSARVLRLVKPSNFHVLAGYATNDATPSTRNIKAQNFESLRSTCGVSKNILITLEISIPKIGIIAPLIMAARVPKISTGISGLFRAARRRIGTGGGFSSNVSYSSPSSKWGSAMLLSEVGRPNDTEIEWRRLLLLRPMEDPLLRERLSDDIL
ncbi:chalcone-flavanone isomerase family protein [Striga asiatica]|uniref:Chalcone-flavanone isomerase family protein n=1 Tax=Striga asiatica TaxID=4170 RepID=A0A5A7RCU2_STRAF|nr:chalcone-flavanone isomerase family protein [Striga asiatica]